MSRPFGVRAIHHLHRRGSRSVARTGTETVLQRLWADAVEALDRLAFLAKDSARAFSSPDGRWTLSPRDLAELLPKQATILDEAQRLVKPGGRLIYVTCSVLPAEDEAQAEAFLARHPDFRPLPVAELWRESVGQIGRAHV